MKLSQYDSAVLVAKNEENSLYITTYGKMTRYTTTSKSDKDFYDSLVGIEYNEINKSHFVSRAYDHAINYFDFKPSEVLAKYPRNLSVQISQNEQVAINTAIMLLNHSNSDHADQCLCYLNTLKNKLK